MGDFSSNDPRVVSPLSYKNQQARLRLKVNDRLSIMTYFFLNFAWYLWNFYVFKFYNSSYLNIKNRIQQASSIQVSNYIGTYCLIKYKNDCAKTNNQRIGTQKSHVNLLQVVDETEIYRGFPVSHNTMSMYTTNDNLLRGSHMQKMRSKEKIYFRVTAT